MSVFVSNLDDFISPGLVCVNPAIIGKAGESDGKEDAANKGKSVSLQEESDQMITTAPVLGYEDDSSSNPLNILGFHNEPNLIKPTISGKNNQKIATVSLNDCLACSGCVTSAETVLIEQQSYSKLLEQIEAKKNTTIIDENTIATNCCIVVAISPQSTASIASKLQLSFSETFLKISAILKGLGVDYVVDTSSTGDIALIEAREEFLHRYRNGKSTAWSKPETSTAYASDKINIFEANKRDNEGNAIPTVRTVGDVVKEESSFLPMIISSCPGWVCYAEKTHPQALPYLSTTKSAQQILGSLFKTYFTSPQSQTYLVSIQPCFDKKLEASRRDFYHEAEKNEGYNEVDLVISTSELWNMLTEIASESNEDDKESSESPSLSTYLSTVSPDTAHGSNEIEKLFRSFSDDGAKLVMAVDSNGGSGGYLEYLMRYSSQYLLGVGGLNEGGNDNALPYQVGRNEDIQHISLSKEGEDTGLKFGKVYGFRNIQSVMLKMKRGKCDYDFIEMMACPSGCVNGGGQLKSDIISGSIEDNKEMLIGTTHALMKDIQVRSPEESPLARTVYVAEMLGEPYGAQAIKVLHTRYHAVPKLEELAPSAVKW